VAPEDPAAALDRLASLARAALTAALRGEPAPAPTLPAGSVIRRGAFVTLRKSGELRGCIGHPHGDRPVAEVVCDMAVAAALEDPRFPPVTADELEEITVEVSVLTPPRRLSPVDPAAVAVGRHGLILRHRGAAGLLLPQVAVEHGFDAVAFLEAVCRKAGLRAGAWRHPEAEVLIFEAEVFGE
jgi:AmmeMemoRadiSam system protein A